MPPRSQVSIDDVNILSKAWGEIKKINWHEINRLTQQNFHIGLVGSPEDTTAMRNWLKSFPCFHHWACVSDRTAFSDKEMEKHVAEIAPEQFEIDEKLIKSSMFCLVPHQYMNEIRRHKVDCYFFETDGDNSSLPPQILSNHVDMRFALSYNFPVFRPKHANREIDNTAFQNAAWAIFSGMPNSIPGPHRVITSPLEGISDFAFLTMNELKLMFELIGLSGHRVRPMRHLGEVGFLFTTAIAAEIIATNIISKMPNGLALITKGAVAYAFTWAIGEGLFYYLNTGRKASQQFLQRRFKRYYGEGKVVAQHIICSKNCPQRNS